METRPITLRVPADDADRIAREAAEHGLSINAYVHQTVMADVNKDVARFIAPLRDYADALNADPAASAAFDELDARIDPKPRPARRAAA